jgi:hypothetical protein
MASKLLTFFMYAVLGVILRFVFHWNWIGSIGFPAVIFILRYEYDTSVKKLEDRIVDKSAWLAVQVVARHAKEVHEYQESCEQLYGFLDRYGIDAPADTHDDLSKRMEAARAKLRGVVRQEVADK